MHAGNLLVLVMCLLDKQVVCTHVHVILSTLFLWYIFFAPASSDIYCQVKPDIDFLASTNSE